MHWPAADESIPNIVDYPFGTQRLHRRRVGRAAHPGCFCTEMPGKLHRSYAHASGSAVYKHFFSAFQRCFLQKVKGGRPAKGDRRSLFPGQVGWLDSDGPVCPHAFVLGMGAHFGAAEGKHGIARFEPIHVFAGRFDPAGQFHTENFPSRPLQTESKARDEPKTGRHVHAAQPPIPGCHRRGVYLDENLVDLGDWCVHYLDFENIRRTVSFLYNGFHVSPVTPKIECLLQTISHNPGQRMDLSG